MSRKLLLINLCGLSVVAGSVIARSAAATPYLVTSLEVQVPWFPSFTTADLATPPYTGPGAAAPGTNTYWNELTNQYGNDAGSFNGTNIYFGGPAYGPPNHAVILGPDGSTDTNLSFGYTSGGPGSGYNGTPGFAGNLFGDYLYANPGSVTYTIGNVPTGSYAVYLYSQAGTGNNSSTDFTVNGTAATVNNAGAPFGSFLLGQNYTVIDATPIGGQITIAFTQTPSTTNSGVFNGFQLVNQNVPEPSSFVLAGIGLAAACYAARRRR